jgi:hypothetical protein
LNQSANCSAAELFTKLASAQTAAGRTRKLTLMVNRLGKWWQLWMVLAAIWTFAVVASAWLNLPRARHMPHDPDFLSKLSIEASSIMHGPQIAAKPVRGEMVWLDTPRSVRMYNGTRLEFPAITTDERAAFVASEYRQLLIAEAHQQRWPYLLEMLALWLAPLLVVASATSATATRMEGEVTETRAIHPPFMSV